MGFLHLFYFHVDVKEKKNSLYIMSSGLNIF